MNVLNVHVMDLSVVNVLVEVWCSCEAFSEMMNQFGLMIRMKIQAPVDIRGDFVCFSFLKLKC